MKKVCVLGLGYVGLPAAAMFATHGFQVLGVDIKEYVLEKLNAGDVHIHEPGLKTLVQAALKSGNLKVDSAPAPADVFIIAVPTPLKRDAGSLSGDDPLPRADLSHVVSATQSIVPHLRAGNLVILESTVPPGTATDTLIPILRRTGLSIAGDNGAKAGAVGQHSSEGHGAVSVAYCPERVLPGRILDELVRNDRVIGGIDLASAEMARALYRSFVDGEIFLTDATTAEMVKLMENTYRDVNIALANELALVAERVGIDVWEAIELANRHPRVDILRPGPGVGGHCIAVDPWFIAQQAPQVASLIQSARRINDAMPSHVVEMVKRATMHVANPILACLGLAYKADVDDIRQSPSLEAIRLLQNEGYEVRASDPHVESVADAHVNLVSLEESLHGADCMVILTDHGEFLRITEDMLRTMRHRIVVDTRGLTLRNASASQTTGWWILGTGQRDLPMQL